MSLFTKQRIVGAVVLLAIATILFTLMFDLKDQRQLDTRTQIPEKPDIVPDIVPEPTRPEGIQPAKDPHTAFTLGVDPSELTTDSGKKRQQQAQQDEAPSLDEEGMAKSWLLQVASYKKQQYADELVARMLKDGYRAFYQTQHSDNGKIYRVLVGPKVLKKQLLQEKKAIEKRYRVSTLVVPFSP